MSILPICIIALNARLAAARSGSITALGQSDRRNLPAQASFVLAPAARAFLTAVGDDRVPVAIRFGLAGFLRLIRACFRVRC
jgi:hypothetical protein